MLKIKNLNIASITTLAIILLIPITFSTIQILNHSLQKHLVSKSQEVLTDGIIRSLQFAIISNNTSLIKQQADYYLSNESIYALEISDKKRNIIYRNEKNSIKEVRITKSSHEIYLPFDDIYIDDFSEKIDANDSDELIGHITIYFSPESINKKISHHLILTAIIMSLTAIFIILCFVYNNRINERKFNRLLEESEKIRKKSEEEELFKDNFVKSLSQDIKRPVDILEKLLENIYNHFKKNHNDSIVQKIEACYYSSKSLQAITQELFDFSLFQEEELKNIKEVTNFSSFINSFNHTYKSLFNDKNINFNICRIDGGDFNTFGYFDAKKLSISIQNILENSLTFTHEGSVTLLWEVKNNAIIITIKDTGIGIKNKEISKIFDKHKVLHSNSSKGRGLGLYYTKKLLNAIDADIAVSSSLDFGTKFTISLPVELIASSYTSKQISLDFTGYTSLILVSEEVIAEELKKLLLEFNIRTKYFLILENGLIDALKFNYDLVFLENNYRNTKDFSIKEKIERICETSSPIYIADEANEIQTDTIIKSLNKPITREKVYFLLEKIMDEKKSTDNIIKNFMINNDE